MKNLSNNSTQVKEGRSKFHCLIIEISDNFRTMSGNNSTKDSIKPRFFNRELSWLAFNERVLDQAFSGKYPLLERTRFLSFVSSNLDQFYEIRVAGLMQKVDAGITRASLDGSQPKELLKEV